MAIRVYCQKHGSSEGHGTRPNIHFVWYRQLRGHCFGITTPDDLTYSGCLVLSRHKQRFLFSFLTEKGRTGERTDECMVPVVIYLDTWWLRLDVGCDGCDCDCGGGGGCCGCDCNEGMCIWEACGKKCSWAVMTDGSKPRWCPCCCCWCLPLSGELTNKWGSKSFVATSPAKADT